MLFWFCLFFVLGFWGAFCVCFCVCLFWVFSVFLRGEEGCVCCFIILWVFFLYTYGWGLLLLFCCSYFRGQRHYLLINVCQYNLTLTLTLMWLGSFHLIFLKNGGWGISVFCSCIGMFFVVLYCFFCVFGGVLLGERSCAVIWCHWSVRHVHGINN